MAKLRPVSSEDRFTLVEHLTELRSRIITCIAIFVVAFAFSYWQNGTVLKIVNGPLENAQTPSAKKCTTTGDSLEQSTCFDRAVSDALAKIGPVLEQGGNRESSTEAKRRADALQAVRRVDALKPKDVNRKPVTLGVAEPFFQTLNIAMYGALVLSLPLLLYQLYAFLIPAFTSRERKAIVPLLIGVPFLFYAGVAFGYFLALPRAVDFLQNFNDDAFDILVQAKDYYKFVGLFLAGSGLVFQVPVVVIAISRLGILTPRQLRKKRGIVWIIAAVVAAVITPTPDAVTMILMMAPLVVLFELSVGVAALIERRSPARGPLADWKDLRGGGDDDGDTYDDEDDDGFGGTPGDRGAGPRGSGPSGGAPRQDDDDLEFEDDDEPWAGVFDEDDEAEFESADREAPDPDLLGDPAGPRVADDAPAGTAASARADAPGRTADGEALEDADAPVDPEQDERPYRSAGDEPTLVHPVQDAGASQGDDAGAGPPPFTPPMPGSRRGPAPSDPEGSAGSPGRDEGAERDADAPGAGPSGAPAPPSAEPVEGWMAEADALDADDPYAAGDPDEPPAGPAPRD